MPEWTATSQNLLTSKYCSRIWRVLVCKQTNTPRPYVAGLIGSNTTISYEGIVQCSRISTSANNEFVQPLTGSIELTFTFTGTPTLSGHITLPDQTLDFCLHNSLRQRLFLHLFCRSWRITQPGAKENVPSAKIQRTARPATMPRSWR